MNSINDGNSSARGISGDARVGSSSSRRSSYRSSKKQPRQTGGGIREGKSSLSHHIKHKTHILLLYIIYKYET